MSAQLTLILPLPLARRDNPQTSHRAAERAAKVAPSHRNIIAASLRANGPQTVKGIADSTGLSQYAVSKRLPELSQMGLIELTGLEVDGCREWRKA